LIKKSGSGIRNEQPRPYFLDSLETIFGGVKILTKFFDADPGWKKLGCGIRDPGSATLLVQCVKADEHPAGALA
jgi:hypothetical protein